MENVIEWQDNSAINKDTTGDPTEKFKKKKIIKEKKGRERESKIKQRD